MRNITIHSKYPPQTREGFITLDKIIYDAGLTITKKGKKLLQTELLKEAEFNGVELQYGTHRCIRKGNNTQSLSLFIPDSEVNPILGILSAHAKSLGVGKLPTLKNEKPIVFKPDQIPVGYSVLWRVTTSLGYDFHSLDVAQRKLIVEQVKELILSKGLTVYNVRYYLQKPTRTNTTSLLIPANLLQLTTDLLQGLLK